MHQFTKYNLYNAPEKSVAALNTATENMGFLPNLLGYMAESSVLLNSYTFLAKQISQSGLNPTEREVVIMTINRFHECRYCMSGHSKMAERQSIDKKLIDAIRDDKPLNNRKYAALRSFTLKQVEQRGVVSQTLVDAFFNAGYSKQNALEIIAMIAFKVMSNYANHIIGTELDGVAMDKQWSPVCER